MFSAGKYPFISPAKLPLLLLHHHKNEAAAVVAFAAAAVAVKLRHCPETQACGCVHNLQVLLVLQGFSLIPSFSRLQVLRPDVAKQVVQSL